MKLQPAIVRLLDGLIVILIVLTIFTAAKTNKLDRMHKNDLKSIQFTSESRVNSQKPSARISELYADRYVWDEPSDPLEVLEVKLSELNLNQRIMHLNPVSNTSSHKFSLSSYNLRVTPIDESTLGQLLNVLEDQAPRFVPARIEVNRISTRSELLDVSLTLHAIRGI